MSRSYGRSPKVYNIQVKSRKMTIVHSGLLPTVEIMDIKEATLSALQAGVAKDALDVLSMDPPELDVQTVDDFELCRAIREKGMPTGEYEVLESSKSLRDSGIGGWEVIFLQLRDRETGRLVPIAYTLPPLTEDDQELTVNQNLLGKNKEVSLEIDESTLDF